MTNDEIRKKSERNQKSENGTTGILNREIERNTRKGERTKWTTKEAGEEFNHRGAESQKRRNGETALMASNQGGRDTGGILPVQPSVPAFYRAILVKNPSVQPSGRRP